MNLSSIVHASWFYYRLWIAPFALLFSFSAAGSAVDSWTRRADFPGAARINAVSFVVHGQAFTGTGEDSQGNLLSDFWKFDPDLDTWSQVADFAGGGRKGAVGFSIDTLGYVGTGYDGVQFRKDFWQFNPVTNSWQSTQELGLYNAIAITNGRRDATAVVVESKAYVICGYDGSSGYLKQTWQFDPAADTCWTLKRNLGNVSDLVLFGRRWGVGFAIQDTVYFGTGFSFSQDLKKDFWKYNPLLDAWTQLADFSGDYRSNATGFSLFNKGYIACGTTNSYQNDVWRYDPFFNFWTAVSSYGGSPVCNGISFVINNRAFVGLGNDSLYNFKSDLWEYIPDSTSGIPENGDVFSIKISPNPVRSFMEIYSEKTGTENKAVFSLYNSSGRLCFQQVLTDSRTLLDCREFPGGIYFYSVSDGHKKNTCGKIIVH
ncbi:MAG TPA: T9SS type A sorting domain-containing protein [Bacteroidia bacterium]|nr:T9SS type A sorting domain-containing protein [Bacteroidia bacterium]